MIDDPEDYAPDQSSVQVQLGKNHLFRCPVAEDGE